jgi:hypothetical protein
MLTREPVRPFARVVDDPPRPTFRRGPMVRDAPTIACAADIYNPPTSAVGIALVDGGRMLSPGPAILAAAVDTSGTMA